jgi:hypothetical protein
MIDDITGNPYKRYYLTIIGSGMVIFKDVTVANLRLVSEVNVFGLPGRPLPPIVTM